MTSTEQRKPINLPRLLDMHAKGEKIVMLTCYDATFAHLQDEAGVDVMLIGDSLGNVLHGAESTVAVSMDSMLYHTRSVARGNRNAWIVADLPFDSYHLSKEEAWRNAAQLFKLGAHMVKLEGGGWTNETVRFITERGIPVCGHLGFTPQTVVSLGGFKVQGRGDSGAALLKRHALELQEAGAQMLVLEMVPSAVAREVTEALSIPVIGIGAGVGCSGQVLVLHDMLGISHGRSPRFVRNFMEGSASIQQAVQRYVQDVRSGAFPDDAIHGFK
nr:3-methyl-2-oxobutanoate hydroxymethyltransferase [Pelomonas sp. KK5]